MVLWRRTESGLLLDGKLDAVLNLVSKDCPTGTNPLKPFQTHFLGLGHDPMSATYNPSKSVIIAIQRIQPAMGINRQSLQDGIQGVRNRSLFSGLDLPAEAIQNVQIFF